MMFRIFFLILLTISSNMAITAVADSEHDNDLSWRSWSEDIFTQASRDNRFVILDLEAVWCHWCHVMEQTTYADETVIKLLKEKYLTVRVDQDANPDLSNRYGDYGWPCHNRLCA